MDPGEQPGTRHTTPELRPPGTSIDPAAAATGNHGKVWLALAVVAVLGLIVVLVLPQLVSGPTPETPEPVTPGPVATQPLSPSPAMDPQAARRAAEQTLQDYLHLRARLELANAAAWGEPEWSHAAQAASNGDRLFGQRQFGMAAESYAAACHGACIRPAGAGCGQRPGGGAALCNGTGHRSGECTGADRVAACTGAPGTAAMDGRWRTGRVRA
jgi:hypothetical protein